VTGPVAAGKTTTIEGEPNLTYEVNLSNKEKAFEHLDKLLGMGLKPTVDYVHTTPEVSVERRASRARQDGRTVRIDRSTAQHTDLPATMQAVAEHYGDRVPVNVYDTSELVARKVPVSDLGKLAYTGSREDLLDRQQQHLDKLRDEGTISEGLHRQLSRGTPEIRGGAGREGSGTSERGRGAESSGESGETGEELAQSSRSDEVRGGYNPVTRAIMLGTHSDFATFAHESAHYYLSTLTEMSREAGASERIKGDMNTLLKWFGVKDLDAWQQMPRTGTTRAGPAIRLSQQLASPYPGAVLSRARPAVR